MHAEGKFTTAPEVSGTNTAETKEANVNLKFQRLFLKAHFSYPPACHKYKISSIKPHT